MFGVLSDLTQFRPGKLKDKLPHVAGMNLDLNNLMDGTTRLG